MRISTNMIYEKGTSAIQQQWQTLTHLGQQVSTGRRVITPADDPIAAARALDLTQSRGINAQFATNQNYANDNLKLLENKLSGVGDILQYARERAVQAGNATMTPKDLGYIATDMRAQFEALLALANTQDANNEYLFAGYKSQTKPFEGNIAGISYQGDQGGRTMQVSNSRFMPISLAGTDVFDNTRQLAGSLYNFNSTDNTGTGSLTLAFNPAQPAAGDTGRRYDITYNGATYDVVEYQPGGLDAIPVASGLTGPTLSFNGLEVNVGGAPAAGDSFEVIVASKNVFENFAIFIDTLENPGAGGASSGVAFALENLDYGIENVLKVRAQIGSQMVEIEQLQSVGSDLDLQYASTLSRLQDVDYAEAISNLTQQQTYLQAAQQSFLRITGLSLFNFLQ